MGSYESYSPLRTCNELGLDYPYLTEQSPRKRCPIFNSTSLEASLDFKWPLISLTWTLRYRTPWMWISWALCSKRPDLSLSFTVPIAINTIKTFWIFPNSNTELIYILYLVKLIGKDTEIANQTNPMDLPACEPREHDQIGWLTGAKDHVQEQNLAASLFSPCGGNDKQQIRWERHPCLGRERIFLFYEPF